MAKSLKGVKSKINKKEVNPVFHVQTKEEENKLITPSVIASVVKTGKLNLSNKGLASVPEKVWHIYDRPKPAGLVAVNFDECPDDNSDQWWNQKPLTLLNLSHNTLTNIPGDVSQYLDLTTLLLAHNSLESVPKEVGLLQNLTHVDLSHNKLTGLPREFYQLTNLTQLNLSNNALEALDVGISDLVMCVSLDVSHNRLSSLPDGIGFLVRAETANFSYNRLRELPPDIIGMRSLRALDVAHNELASLPNYLNEMRRLESLLAQQNAIKELPELNGGSELKELFLAHNSISEIPATFCESLLFLKTLDLCANKIEKVPEEIGSMTKLTRLDLTNNSIKEVPVSVSGLPNLRSLQLQGNPIKSIRRDIVESGTTRVMKILRERQLEDVKPVEPLKMPDKYRMRKDRCLNLSNKELVGTCIPKLEELVADAIEAEIHYIDLSHNRLSEFPERFRDIPGISEINLEHNQIHSVPDFVADFSHLFYLNVSHNAIETLPSQLGGLREIRELNVAFNRLTEVPRCVYEMPKLQILIAHDNKIREIDAEGLGKLKSLATLDLCNNEIQTVPPTLGSLRQITSLGLTGNPFRYPRHAIIEKGTQSIMSYLRDRIPEDPSTA